MKVQIDRLKDHNRRTAVVDRDRENLVTVYALNEIAKTIDWCIGTMSRTTLDSRTEEMLEIAALLIRFADTEGHLDEIEITTSEEPDDREPVDDRWDPDEVLRDHPLVSRANDRPFSDPRETDVPF